MSEYMMVQKIDVLSNLATAMITHNLIDELDTLSVPFSG